MLQRQFGLFQRHQTIFQCGYLAVHRMRVLCVYSLINALTLQLRLVLIVVFPLRCCRVSLRCQTLIPGPLVLMLMRLLLLLLSLQSIGYRGGRELFRIPIYFPQFRMGCCVLIKWRHVVVTSIQDKVSYHYYTRWSEGF